MCYAQLLCAKTYYLSSSAGDDIFTPAQAQNRVTPWKTLNKLNAFNGLQAGDSVLFCRGEVFYGFIKINSSGSSGRPIVYSSYGAGEQPVITSLIDIKNWTNVGNGIYESFNEAFGRDMNIVLVKVIVHEMGRYPNSNTVNKGYLKLESHTGNSSISDNELSSAQDWTGAELVIRKNHWIIDRHKIISHSGTRLSYEKGTSIYDPYDGFGYFIQNHIKTLDQFGEWYYNPNTKKLNVYFGSNNPQSVKIEASSIDNLVQSPQKSGVDMYIVFDQLTFRGANRNAIVLNSGNYYKITNCTIEFSGENAIQANGTERLTVANCAILKSNNNGIVSVYNNPDAVIESNKIDSTFMFPGMGQSGDGNGIGLNCIGKDSRVEKNIITNTGYSAVSFGGDYVQIKNNFIDGFCMVKDDGSGIYTFTGSENKNYFGRKIINNIVLNGVGACNGTDSDYSPAEGIYLDDNVSGVLVSGNTIANITNYGIYLHNSRNITLKSNTIFNAGTQINLIHDELANPIRDVKIYDNVLFSKKANQKLLSLSSIKNDLTEMVKLDSNFYDRPIFNSGVFVSTRYRSDNSAEVSTDFDLDKWKADSKQDISSQKNLVIIPEYKLLTVSDNNKIKNGDFDKSIDGVGTYSPTNRIKLSRSENGSLEVASSGLAYTIFSLGAISTSTLYVLKFDAVANKSSTINVYLRQDQAPYKILSDVKSFTSGTTIKAMEFLFQATIEEKACVLVIESKDLDLAYRIDNVKFSEAAASLTNLDDYIRFEYNPTSTVKAISLDNVYINARNQEVRSQIALQPYTSEILILQKKMIVPASPDIVCDDVKNTITASHSLGQSEILVSENNGAFAKYEGTISVGNISRAPGYWKFKIKKDVDRAESNVVNSEKFTQDYSTNPGESNPTLPGQLKLYPNPVTNVARVFISAEETGQGTLSVYNFYGYKLMTVAIQKTSRTFNDNLNFSYLKPGIYMLVARINGKTFIQKVVKI